MFPGARLIGIGLIAVALASALAARADDGDDDATRTVRVGYSDFPPYVLSPPGSPPTGFGVEILRKIAAEQDLELVFVQTANPGETLALLRNGELDATTLLSWSAQRVTFADHSTPVSKLEVAVFTPAGTPSTPSDLSGRSIGVVSGSAAIADVTRALPDAPLVQVRSISELVVALLTGEVEAVAIPAGPFRALLRRADVSERFVAGDALRTHDLGFFVGEGKDDLLQAINRGIADLSARGEINDLHREWFGREKRFFERTNVRVLVSAGALTVLALLVGGGVAWRANRRARRSAAEVGINRMLIDAFDGTQSSVIIWDGQLRANHWNEATVSHLPALLPDLQAGITFGEFMRLCYGEGHLIAAEAGHFDLDPLFEDLERQLKAGRTEPRLVSLPDGRVLETVDLKIGTNMFASVSKDVTRLEEKASQERETSEVRFEALFESAAIGLAKVAEDGALIRANGKLASILSTRPEHLVGRSLFEFVHEGDVARLEGIVLSVLCDMDHEPHTEFRMLDGAGEGLWADMTLSKVSATSLQPAYLVICVEDITERRHVEDQRTILVGELSHRVKNILAVVQTITMQTLRGMGAGEDVRHKVFIRLRAISAAHDIVFRSGTQDIQSVLNAQLEPFQGVGVARIDMEGPKVELPVDLVYALGLIIHELITNAVKYGALSNLDGRIGVRWWLDGSKMHLRWTEMGGPPVEAPDKSGFGSRLIAQMASHTREGEANFDFRPEGIVVDLSVRLED